MFSTRALVDPVEICPYNKNHLISKSRLQKHIVKCEKNYPEGYKELCPYNATHRVFKHELEEHVITCPMRVVMEAGIYEEPRKHGATNFMSCSEISSTIDCKERWDIDSDCSDIVANDDCFLNDDTDMSVKTVELSVDHKHVGHNELRSPRGFSEAMLKEVNDESCIEDQESVVSSMGIGRGKIKLKQDRVLKIIQLGRGKPLNKES